MASPIHATTALPRVQQPRQLAAATAASPGPAYTIACELPAVAATTTSTSTAARSSPLLPTLSPCPSEDTTTTAPAATRSSSDEPPPIAISSAGDFKNRIFPSLPRPEPPSSARAQPRAAGCDRVGGYAFQPTARIGTTLLAHGHDLSTSPPTPVTCRAVEAAQLGAFMKGEGCVLQAVAHSPHPNLPKLVRTVEGAAAGRGYLVFPEYHATLHGHVRDSGRLPEHEAAFLFRQLVQAVSHCHSRSVVLRDIKLGKLLFADRARTRLVLADLSGAVCSPVADPLLRDQKGSPAYVAPEVLTGKPYRGAAADVWALGVVLYVMLTGRYPFRDAHPSHLFRKIVAGEVDYPSHLSPAAVEVLDALFSTNPAQRPTARELLSAPWLRAGPTAGTTASPAGGLRRQLSPPAAAAPAQQAEAMDADDCDQVVPDLDAAKAAAAAVTGQARQHARQGRRGRGRQHTRGARAASNPTAVANAAGSRQLTVEELRRLRAILQLRTQALAQAQAQAQARARAAAVRTR